MANPWHDIDPGTQIEKFFYSIIEIPKGSKNKYEMDKATGLLRADRVLFSSVVYPANYGLIPRTYCGDKDPLDVLVLGQEPIHPLCIVRCKAIGMISMTDEQGKDDKIIAVHADDPAYADYNDISALPQHVIKELQRFFEDYKILEDKEVTVGELKGRVDAINVINSSLKLYDEKKDEILGVSAA